MPYGHPTVMDSDDDGHHEVVNGLSEPLCPRCGALTRYTILQYDDRDNVWGNECSSCGLNEFVYNWMPPDLGGSQNDGEYDYRGGF